MCVHLKASFAPRFIVTFNTWIVFQSRLDLEQIHNITIRNKLQFENTAIIFLVQVKDLGVAFKLVLAS